MGLVEDMQDEKGVIWVVHPDTAVVLAEVFKKKNPIVITGSTKSELRQGMIDDFRTKDKHRLLIANIDVLSTSYTIVEAKWQIYLERHFNYTAFSQSKKRIHRIGQDKIVKTNIIKGVKNTGKSIAGYTAAGVAYDKTYDAVERSKEEENLRKLNAKLGIKN